jgi:hypothetical protein
MNSNSQMTMAFWLRVRHVWVHGFLIGLLLGALGIGAYYLIAALSFFQPPAENPAQSLARSRSEKTMPVRPNISPPQPLNPEANLELQLAQVIEGIKETTLKKDLDGLRQLYSPSFPNLSKKLQRITGSWKIYDYQKMDFKIHEIKPLTETSAAARITWDLSVKVLATGKTKDISKTYEVNFIKDHEHWRIMGLKNVTS